jgi:hypothetical protein
MISNITLPNGVPENNYSAIKNTKSPVSESFIGDNENKYSAKVNMSERFVEEVSKTKVISDDEKNEIIKAVASNNDVKIHKLLNTFFIDDLAKLRFDFKTTNGNQYINVNLFFLACRSGCINLVKTLINNKHVDINELFYRQCDGDITALIMASGSHVEITKMLLDHGADITKKNSKGITVEVYSLVISMMHGIDVCYEMQNLFHEYRKKQGLPLGEISGTKRKNADDSSGSYPQIIFFNNNKDFVIFFYDIENKIIKNITHKSTHVVVQKILDKIRSYVMSADKCISKEIIGHLNKAAVANNIAIIDDDDDDTENMNLIDILYSQFEFLGKNLLENIDQNYIKSKLISYLYDAFIKNILLEDYNGIVKDLKEAKHQVYSLEEFGNLDDLSKLPAEQQETVINAVVYFICTRSQSIPLLLVNMGDIAK